MATLRHVESHRVQLVGAGGSDALCASCQLTRTRPADGDAEGLTELVQSEMAKRRLIFQLAELGLPVEPRREATNTGLAFDPLSSSETKVVTGHEIGHYYWPLLVRDPDTLRACRALFGDDSADYAEAVKVHYDASSDEDESWMTNYISRYATMHPCEDWTETFAHYLHILDTLQTAESFGLGAPAATGARGLTRRIGAHPTRPAGGTTFGQVIDNGLELSYALNQINRSMGHKDLYPFVLAAPVIRKMAFVDHLVHQR
jgi:hypothetical protein